VRDERVAVVAMKRTIGSESGFTIAELVIASAILIVVATSIMGALAFASTASAATARRETALQIANRHLEQARTMPYVLLGTRNGDPVGSLDPIEHDGDYTIATYVEYARSPVTLVAASKMVQITVSWTTPHPGSVRVETNIGGRDSYLSNGDVTVHVIDDFTNEPVHGATIVILPSVGVSRTKSTDSEGVAAWFGHVPQGNCTITGTCPGYLLVNSFTNPVGISPDRDNPFVIRAIKLNTGVVPVKNSLNQPLGGVLVKIVGPTGGTFTATSGADGLARFTDLQKDTYTVTGTLTGYTSGTTNLAVLGGGLEYTASPSLTMTKNATLKVTCVDQAGAALPGALVTLSGAAALTGTTGTDGSYTFDLTKAGTYSVSASKTGCVLSSTGSQTVVLATDYVLSPNLVLRNTTLKVTVVDEAGAVLPGTLVTLSGAAALTGTTGSDGSYTFTLTTAGTYSVSASLTNYVLSSTGSKAVVLGNAYVLSPNLILRRTILRVTVRDNYGVAMSGVTVTLSGAAAKTGTTGADGIATFYLTTAGTYTIAVTAPTNYTAPTNTTQVVVIGGTYDVPRTLTKAKGTLKVAYTQNTTAHTVYIYNSNVVGALPVDSFPVAARASGTLATSTSRTLDFGQYYVSSFTPFRATAVTAGVLNGGSTVTVTLNSAWNQ